MTSFHFMPPCQISTMNKVGPKSRENNLSFRLLMLQLGWPERKTKPLHSFWIFGNLDIHHLEMRCSSPWWSSYLPLIFHLLVFQSLYILQQHQVQHPFTFAYCTVNSPHKHRCPLDVFCASTSPGLHWVCNGWHSSERNTSSRAASSGEGHTRTRWD